MEKPIRNHEHVVFPIAIDPAGNPDQLLATARLFCTNTSCRHYHSVCIDGNESVWVECPTVNQYWMEVRDMEGITSH